MDLLVGLGGLVCELVAGEVEDFEALVAVLRVDALKILVLRGESTTGGGVHDEQDLAFIGGQRHLGAIGLDCDVIINGHGGSFLFALRTNRLYAIYLHSSSAGKRKCGHSPRESRDAHSSIRHESRVTRIRHEQTSTTKPTG